VVKRTRKTDPERTSKVATENRPLAAPWMLLGLTPEAVPLPDPDRVWSVLALASTDAAGTRHSAALTTRLRALALLALDLAAGLEDCEAASNPNDEAVDWYRTLGTDVVERAAAGLGVLHAVRAKETRREFRRTFALAQRQAGLESELAALRAFLIEREGPLPARLREAQRASLLARALAWVEGHAEPTPASWRWCVEDPANFDDLLKERIVPLTVRLMVATSSLSRERLYALRRWRLRVWGDAAPEKARLVAHLDLRGPPRGIPDLPRTPEQGR
jgi:hypothetical protein